MTRIYAALLATALVSGAALAEPGPRPTQFPAAPPAASMTTQDAMRAAYGLGFGTGQEVAAEMIRLNTRVAELERLCGEPCRPKTEPAAK